MINKIVLVLRSKVQDRTKNQRMMIRFNDAHGGWDVILNWLIHSIHSTKSTFYTLNVLCHFII